MPWKEFNYTRLHYVQWKWVLQVKFGTSLPTKFSRLSAFIGLADFGKLFTNKTANFVVLQLNLNVLSFMNRCNVIYASFNKSVMTYLKCHCSVQRKENRTILKGGFCKYPQCFNKCKTKVQIKTEVVISIRVMVISVCSAVLS